MAQYNKYRYQEALFIISLTLLLPSKAVGIELDPVVIQDGQSSPGMCPSDETLQAVLEDLQRDVRMALGSIYQEVVLIDQCGPGQWRRAAYVNMTDPQQQCPSGWTEHTTSGIRACGRSTSCSGTMFATGRQYSKVCGRVTAYQQSSPDAFCCNRGAIDGAYVDGVSVTYGSPRNHIWTFAGGWSELSHANSNVFNCPCSDSPGTTAPPSFVGNNYFCESANKDEHYRDNHVYTEDKLWDGEQCDNEGTCCTDMSPPWFSVELPDVTADNIEVRICGNEGLHNENTLIELLEVYVQ